MRYFSVHVYTKHFKTRLFRTAYMHGDLFSGPLGSWMVCYLHLKVEFRSCHRRASVVWHISLSLFQKDRGSYFPHADYSSWGLSRFLRIMTY